MLIVNRPVYYVPIQVRVYIFHMGTYNQVKNSAHREQKTIYYYPESVFSVPNHLRKRATLRRRYTYTLLRCFTIIIVIVVIIFMRRGCFLYRPSHSHPFAQLFIIDVPAALVHYNIIKYNNNIMHISR